MALALVTGVAGFIGSSIARALLEEGHTVRGFDDLSTGNFANINKLPGQIDFRHESLRDQDALLSACSDVEIVFHQAALPSVAGSILDPKTSHEANVDSTLHLLLAARAMGVRRIIYAASASAYGASADSPQNETMTPAPVSPYAVQKLCGEHYMRSFNTIHGLETVCLRYFNVFGPFQSSDSPYSGVLAKFITDMLRGTTPTIFGDGEQTRDFIYISNIVQANLCAAWAPSAKVAGNVYNVACGEGTSLLAAYDMIRDVIDFPHTPKFGPARIGDVRHSVADISAAKRDFGYSPNVSVREGLAKTIAWYRATQQAEAEPASLTLASIG